MGHLGDHGAERDHHRGVDRSCDLGDGIAEGPPEQVGFDPLDQHEITGLVGQRQDVDPVIGPVDDTTAVVSDADLGPALAEVEEWVGVDDPDLDPPGASQGLDRSGSGAADVEEALERSDKDRRTQGGQIGGPLEHGHQPSMPAHHGFGTVDR
jgi:hypothetical protein